MPAGCWVTNMALVMHVEGSQSCLVSGDPLAISLLLETLPFSLLQLEYYSSTIGGETGGA